MRTNIRFFEEEIGLRFLHLGDLHFGKIVNSFSMLEDQQYVLEQVKEYVKTYEPDAVLLAGDIYDRSVPPARAVSLYSQFLQEPSMKLGSKLSTSFLLYYQGNTYKKIVN